MRGKCKPKCTHIHKKPKFTAVYNEKCSPPKEKDVEAVTINYSVQKIL